MGIRILVIEDEAEIAEDAGRVLHPDLLTGQIQGGIAQGIGYALGEDLLFDPSGTMFNPSMVDYQVPTAPEVPPVAPGAGESQAMEVASSRDLKRQRTTHPERPPSRAAPHTSGQQRMSESLPLSDDKRDAS